MEAIIFPTEEQESEKVDAMSVVQPLIGAIPATDVSLAEMQEERRHKIRGKDDLKKETNDGLASPLASEESMRNSLEFLRNGSSGLNKHRQSLLCRVPDSDTYASFPLNAIEYRDLAYLSAATGDEFALLRGKHEDILYHGTQLHCHIEDSDILMTLLRAHKLKLEIHSHPDYGKITPSSGDRNFLKAIGQKKSRIISSYTGQITEFSGDEFEFL